MKEAMIDTTNPDPYFFNCLFENYSDILKKKAERLKTEKGKELLSLDKWYQEELPALIQIRSKKHITHPELCKLMTWKLTRGKFRPRLTQLVQTNSEAVVTETSQRAFKQMPDLKSAIKSLSELKAVGPATASAVLAAGCPNKSAFMADEAMQCFPDLQPLQYTLNFYLQYMQNIDRVSKTLNKYDSGNAWTPHKVEIALWTWRTSKILGTEISQNGKIDTCPKDLEIEEMDEERTEKAKRLSRKRKR
ncbi:hypothetical protein ScPMuIL_005084 [Solemya velum]